MNNYTEERLSRFGHLYTRQFRKRLRRLARDRRLSAGLPWKQAIKTNGLRARMDREDDAVQMPKPLPPRPPRREKRGQSKPR